MLKDNLSGIPCQLSVHSLDSCPEYYALSYCWGPPTVAGCIQCNEVEFPITANLFSALQNLCHPDKGMLIWIDAICINQADEAEKAEQVGIMRHIYSNAIEVLVWLGPAANDSDLSIRACQDLALQLADFMSRQTDNDDDELDDANQVRTEFALPEDSLEYKMAEDATTRRRWRNLKRIFTEFESPRWSERQVRALLAIVSRPWWTRIWIVQELCLARRARVIVGQSSIEWKAFAQAVNVASYYHPASLGLARSAFFILADLKDDWDWERYSETKFASSTTESSLLPLLARLRWNQATDARDKVYGLLGLAKDGDAVPISYKATVAEVYQMAARTIIQETGSLDVLAHCLKPHLSKPSELRLPSWVPDWSYDRTHLPRSHDRVYMDAKTKQMKTYRATGYEPKGHHDRVPRPTCGDILILDGVVLDHVTVLSPEISWTLFRQGTSRPAAQLADNVHNPRSFTQNPVLNSIWHLIAYLPALVLEQVNGYYHIGAMLDLLIIWLELVRSVQAEGGRLEQAELLVGTMNWGALPEHETKSTANRLCRQMQCIYENRFFHLTRWLRFHKILPFFYKITLGISICLSIVVDAIMRFVGGNPEGNINSPAFHTAAMKFLISEFNLIPSLVIETIDYRLAKTATGQIVLVPYCTRIEDRVVLLKGGRSPFVVRPKERGWEIVGACFVHGMANSERWKNRDCLFAEMEFV